MILNDKIKKAIELHPEVIVALQNGKPNTDWTVFTRTHFNAVAKLINKKITQEVIKSPELVERFLVIGKLKTEKEIYSLRKKSIPDFIGHLNSFSPYQVYNWISGKTLQSYWNGGFAKDIKVNAMLVFLKVPFGKWGEWLNAQPDGFGWGERGPSSSQEEMFFESAKSSMTVVRKYYTGNYFLYYQKTDGSPNIIKTPFVLKEDSNGDVVMQSVSEGHRYMGRVMGVRDGCLYINCQNLDFEEMEQYVFNIGLETKPEVLFGVSNTVSVKDRLAVGLKNVLVKQRTNEPGFEKIGETEIPFSKKYVARSEEAVIVQYLKNSGSNVITSRSCCDLGEMEWQEK
jgi:hypothetical protein